MVVYKITNKINNKSYIGITKNFKQRMYEHTHHYKKHSLIGNKIKEYGSENFTFEILFDELTIAQAKEKEIEMIQYYNSFVPNGYNKTLGGDMMMGYSNGRAKLTKDQVIDIRTRFHNGEKHWDIYEEYKDIISFNDFKRVVTYKTYLNDNLIIGDKIGLGYNSGSLKRFENDDLLFSKAELDLMRDEYVKGTPTVEVFNMINKKCNFDYFRHAYTGRSYGHYRPEVFTDENKRKQHSKAKSGEYNSHAKLTWEDVRYIRDLRDKKLPYTLKELATRFNVSVSSIKNVINNTTWKE